MLEKLKIDKSIPLPAYWQIKEYIEQAIRNGELLPGNRLPSEMELSKMLGISPMTARQAFTALVNGGLLVRQQGKGTFVADTTAAVTVSHDIGLVFKDFHGEDVYTMPILAGAEEICAESGYAINLHLVSDHFKAPASRLLCRLIEQRQLAGVIINGPMRDEDFALLQQNRLPYVFVDIDYRKTPVHTVLLNDHLAVTSMLGSLYRQGHRRIGMICGPLSSPDAPAERRANKMVSAYREFCNAHDIDFDPVLIRHGEQSDVPNFCQELFALSKPPTGMITCGDGYAAGVQRAAVTAGIAIPEQLTICNYNDSANVFWPGVRKPLREMGRNAARLLLELIRGSTAGHSRIILDPKES